MDPYGTFGTGPGIKSPLPSPKGDVSQIPAPAQAIPTMDPSWPQFQSMQKIPTAAPSSGFQDPKADYLQQAIDIYDSIDSGPTREQNQVQVSVTGEEAPQSADSWRDRIYADREASAARNSGGSYAGGGSAQRTPSAPYEAIKAPDMPKFQGEEYTPPERDEAIYDEERRKAMGPGMRALREGTREAISSSQSLDNPNARSKFIKQALHGYGQGLESVASQADRQATTTADRRHSEALNLYKTKYEYKRNTDLMNYQTEVNQIAADFASESAASIANYNAGFAQDGSSGSSVDARSKATYYGNGTNSNDPFMGYM